MSRISIILLSFLVLLSNLEAGRNRGNHGNSGKNGSYYGLTPEVRECISRAKMEYSDFSRDQMLLRGVRYARSIDDVLALAGHTSNSYTKSQILSNRENLARDVDEIIRYAMALDNDYSRDQVLLRGVKLARSVDDIIRLAERCNNNFTKSQIVSNREEMARDVNDVVRLAKAQNNDYTHDQILLRGIKLAHSSYEFRYLAREAKSEYTRRQILRAADNVGPGPGPSPTPPYPDYDDTDTQKARRAYRRGREFHDRGEYNRALRAYNQGKAYHNRWGADCLFNAGYCNVKLGRYYDATRDYEKYIRDYPNGEQVAAAHYVCGRAYEEVGDYRQARKLYRQTVLNYSHTQYARKARERLSQLGGGNSGGHYNRPFSSVESSILKSKTVDSGDPFTGRVHGNLKDAVQSLDPAKTHRSFLLKLRQKLSFEKVHGNKEAKTLLEILKGK
ncbi:tol-pal system YbgF family protein [Candidatus Riflebacteria bacterium]